MSEDTTTTWTPAANVVEAVARVMEALPAIGKDGRAAASQGGYAYRGIEQITREAQRLFARERVIFVPRVRGREIVNITVAGKPWTDTILDVDYNVYGPGGTEDRLPEPVAVVGIGRDNSDKGANKAMTQAFKYALLQVLCISDANDDADGQTHEAEEHHDPRHDPADPDTIAYFLEELGNLTEDSKGWARAEWERLRIPPVKQLTQGTVEQGRQVIRAAQARDVHAAGTPAPPEATEPEPGPAPALAVVPEPEAPPADPFMESARNAVRIMTGRVVDASLAERGLTKSGNLDERKERLARNLVDDARRAEAEGAVGDEPF